MITVVPAFIKSTTLIVTSSEQNSASFIPNKTLSNTSVSSTRTATKRRRITGFLVQNRGGRQDLDGERVAVGSRFEVTYLDEHRLPLHYRCCWWRLLVVVCVGRCCVVDSRHLK
ncbi:hypothetical protein HanXRQr2_Chr16g0757001 [Helianthus annuus]|uniref:Uncharacterized protein n=1 Tax=Helianthus annuus TaxID=4232 RepID=A0A9K3DUJ5_HELAN|nr:hypothetical protein HanXRQr2_Chr16g0757001 [Helianthus annuus]KAJ0821890.1 hypothetical protein HanPSC8_Chr16g0725511 [Helianthus annuus]